MRFLIDADLPRLESELERFGYISIDSRDVGLADAPDEEILDYAKTHKLIILTRDLEFGNIKENPVGSNSGIVVFRYPYFFVRRQIKNMVSNFLSKINHNNLENSLTVVKLNQFRIKK